MKHSATRTIAAAATALAIALPLAACSQEDSLIIKSATGEHSFTVEVVDNPETRAKGLMYVQELAPNAGMLFDFLEERPVAFWMMNTYIPLDMLFIASDGTVKNIQVNARPHDRTSIPSDGAVQYVLEVPGGRTVELGIKAGDTVVHSRIK
jgi:uncharacterized membrane protein (UPF0127 family)